MWSSLFPCDHLGQGAAVSVAPKESVDAPMRIRAVVTIYDGSLARAAEQAAGLSSRAVIDWPGTVEAFRVQRVEKLKVTSSATWAKKYQPPLVAAVAALAARKQPMDAQSLLDVVLARWKPGSRSRQIARQSLSKPLRWPARASQSSGGPPVHEREARAAKREGWALSDVQIIRLVDELPDTPVGHRWRFAVQLLATFGLRPEELRFRKIEDGELKCNYRKAAGPGRRTPPRRLYPLMVRDGDGNPVDWHLADRLAAGESLPPLGQPGKGAEALRTFLVRQPAVNWCRMRSDIGMPRHQLLPRWVSSSGSLAVLRPLRARWCGCCLGHGKPIAELQPASKASAYSPAMAWSLALASVSAADAIERLTHCTSPQPQTITS